MEIEKQPLFDNEDPEDRYTILPILNNDIWEMYQTKALPATWFVTDVSLIKDVSDWESKLNDNERHFLKMVLAFFAGSDKLVADNISNNFIDEVPVEEAKQFYSHQCFMENIHAHMYAKLLETYIIDIEERNFLFKSLETIPVVAAKGQWARRYSDKGKATFQERLVAFAIFEGIFFSGSFAAIFYMKKRGFLPGLCMSNDYISRDERMHCDFACLLYSHLLEKLPEATVHQMFREAVDIEIEFTNEALKASLIGLNAKSMAQYVKFIADYWLLELGYKKIFNVKNPFDWMHLISMENKTNFFEARVSEYAKPGVGKNDEDNTFGYDDEF